MLAHATAPFLRAETIEQGLNKVLHEGCDSALSVQKMQELFWRDGKPMNYDPDCVPRTQDLEPVYAETTGLYIYKRDLIIKHNRRIGFKTFLIEVSKIEAADINEPVDFEIADAIFNGIMRKNCPRGQRGEINNG